MVFAAIFPVVLSLSYIRTLKRLSIASAAANVLQAVGISIILEYLIRDIGTIDLEQRDKFRPFGDSALGFGSAMFAFEGISVVLPCYTRMKNSHRMSGSSGVINVSYGVLLVLYFTMGLFGFLKFGRDAGDSITLNLPPEPLYDAVRAIFTCSVMLTYPLQFYVPNEIIWNWAKRNILVSAETLPAATAGSRPELIAARALEVVIPTIGMSEKNIAIANGNSEPLQKPIEQPPLVSSNSKENGHFPPAKNTQTIATSPSARQLIMYEYYCRTLVVILTFVLAISVPKLNLLMDLIGSITGTMLSLILPALIHMAAFWEDLKGTNKIIMILVNSLIITFGLLAGISGTIFSAASIIKSFS